MKFGTQIRDLQLFLKPASTILEVVYQASADNAGKTTTIFGVYQWADATLLELTVPGEAPGKWERLTITSTQVEGMRIVDPVALVTALTQEKIKPVFIVTGLASTS